MPPDEGYRLAGCGMCEDVMERAVNPRFVIEHNELEFRGSSLCVRKTCNTDISDEERSECVVSKLVGDSVYTAINREYGDYIIIDKRRIQ